MKITLNLKKLAINDKKEMEKLQKAASKTNDGFLHKLLDIFDKPLENVPTNGTN